MKRTIEVRYGWAYYRGQTLGTLCENIRNHFNMAFCGTEHYKISVRDGGRYRISRYYYKAQDASEIYYYINLGNGMGLKHAGVVCQIAFTKLFFKPDGRKRYDITVKRVK